MEIQLIKMETEVLEAAGTTREQADAVVRGLIDHYQSRNKVGHNLGKSGTSGSGYVKRLLEGRVQYTAEILGALAKMVEDTSPGDPTKRLHLDMTWLNRIPSTAQESDDGSKADAGPGTIDQIGETDSTRTAALPTSPNMDIENGPDWRDGVRDRLATYENEAEMHRHRADALRIQAVEEDAAAARATEQAERIKGALDLLADV